MWEFGGVEGHRDWIRTAVDSFNTSRQDIQIHLEFRDWSTQRESLISSTIMGEGPDIIRVHHKYSVEFGQLGGLYPLERFADFPQVKGQIFANAWEQVAFEGQHYGVPVTLLPFILAANRNLMDSVGVAIPETWEELRAAGELFKAHDLHAFTMPGGLNLDSAYRFLPLLFKAGGRVLNEDWSAAAFNGPAGVGALRFLVDLKTAGYMPAAAAAYAFDENTAHWCGGRAAMSIEGPWWQNTITENYDFDLANLALALIPGPSVALEDGAPRTLLDVVMVSITGYSKVPEPAWEVIKALNVEHPVWRSPNPGMGGIPALKAAYGPGVESDYIDLEVLAAAAANGRGWPGHPAITEIQRHLADAVNVALTGVRGPREALDDAAVEVNELLEDY
jgi:ABC-type glycerol-3-phosphate transport system substrate-binding protein